MSATFVPLLGSEGIFYHMAVAAETLTSGLFEDYRLVDDIPEVAQARQVERLGAQALLESRRDGQRSGTEAAIPPVDALSTAHSVLEMARVHGEESDECQERFAGLLLDCQRLVAEWYRKKKPEYFPPVRHFYDEATEEFFSHGLSIRQMTQNALLPIADNPEEEMRRVNEKVEDATPQILRRLGQIALGDQAIRTISQCTDKAEADFDEDSAWNKDHKDDPDFTPVHRGYDGYVPEIKKLMVRDIRLDKDTQDRFEEQIGMPGVYITPDVVRIALDRRGVNLEGADKTHLHGSQLLAKDDLMDFAALLDEVASEQWCTNIFMGEEVPADYEKNYGTFRQEALERQEGLKDQAHKVANFVLDLANDDVDKRVALTMVEDFVKMMLLEMAKQDMTVAEQMFDERTVIGLKEVIRLESIGEHGRAFEAWQKVEAAAPGGGYCGGGSCGLESINMASEAGKTLAEALKAAPGDTIVKDKVRSCKCGSKSIVYAYSAKRVNKYCENCKSFESKASIATKS